MENIITGTPLQYKIEHLLGQGANGRVYLASRFDFLRQIEQKVAIKILNSQTQVDDWKNEFASLARVQSDFCVRVYGFEWIGTEPALILEHIEGLSLAEMVQSSSLSQGLIDEISSQIERGLLDLHRSGLCHGDLSLSNVMIDREGRVKLLDFGFGNTTGARRRATIEFADPRLLMGGSCTPESDFIALEKMRVYLLERKQMPSKGLHPIVCDLGELVRIIMAQNANTIQLTASLALHEEPPFGSRGYARRLKKVVEIVKISIAMALALSAAGPQASVSSMARAAALTVRSQDWLWLEWDGRSVGYAPVDVFYIEPGQHILSWRSATAAGSLTLTLQPGDHILLDDKKLLHH